jgi:hypothetical protein
MIEPGQWHTTKEEDNNSSGHPQSKPTKPKPSEPDSSLFLILVCCAIGFVIAIGIINSNNEQDSRNLSFVHLSNVRESPTTNGYIGVFSNLTNGSNKTMKTVEVTIYYYNQSNEVIYSEKQEVSNIYSGQTNEFGFFKKNVQNCVKTAVGVNKVDFY